MKGKLSLGEFISRVKDELVSAQDRSGKPFFELKNVELEVSFVLDVSAKATGDLFVVELSGQTKAQQTHKVKLCLEPLPALSHTSDTAVDERVAISARSNAAPLIGDGNSPGGAGGHGPGGGGGRGGLLDRMQPLYAPPPTDPSR